MPPPTSRAASARRRGASSAIPTAPTTTATATRATSASASASTAGVAKELRERAADPNAVRDLVEQARDAAWGDVEANLQRRLAVEGMRADVDPDYDMMRAARMQSLRLIDLPRLAAHRRHLAPERAACRSPSSSRYADPATERGVR